MTWENRVTFEVSSADPDSDMPVWVDLTSRVRDARMPTAVDIGRQTDLSQSDPATLKLLLDDADDALSVGNTSSPYASWWGPGRKCRLRERIGSRIIDQYTGYTLLPTEALVTAGIEQWLTLTAVDRLGRLGSAEPFISTVGAHIMGSVGAAALVGYWPCTEDSKRFLDVWANALPSIEESKGLSSTSIIPTAGAPAIRPQGAPALLVDDANGARLEVATGVSGANTAVAVAPDMRLTSSPSRTVGAGDLITIVGWFRSEMPTDKSGAVLLEFSDNQCAGRIRFTAADGTMTLSLIPPGVLTATVSGPVIPDQAWVPLAIRYGWDTGVIELWVGRNVYTGSISGSPSGPNALTTFNVVRFFAGSFAHVQLYIGPSAAYTNAMFVEQVALAQAGLERQSTGDRIRSIATYAGVRGGELDLDAGTSVMQVASLAGKTPLQAMREAERTEQGLLYVNGSGVLCFRDRRSLYNI